MFPWRQGGRHIMIACHLQDTHSDTRWPVTQQAMKPTRDQIVMQCKDPVIRQRIRDDLQVAMQQPTSLMQIDQTVRRALLSNTVAIPRDERKPWQHPSTARGLADMWKARRALQQQALQSTEGKAYENALENFKQQRRELRKDTLQRRRDLWETQLQEAEQAHARGNIREFYQTVKRLAPRPRPGKVQLRDDRDQLLGPKAELDAIHKYWTQIFDVPSLPTQQWVLQSSMRFELNEVLHILRKLPVHKAASPGCAPAIGWQVGAEQLAPPMLDLLHEMFKAGPISIDVQLTTAWLCFLPKPNRTNRKAEDLRPIGLQPVPSKVITALLRSRLQPYVDVCVEQVPQYAYTKHRSTLEAIAIAAGHCQQVRQAVQDQKLGLHERRAGVTRQPCAGGGQLALDFSRAFDSLPRAVMKDMLKWASVPTDLITALLAWHEQTMYHFGTPGTKDVREIRVSQGVKQGCLIAPSLWTIYTCYMCHLINQEMGDQWYHEHFVGFADDVHLRWLLHSYAECEQMCTDIDRILQLLRNLKVHVNPSKSHLLVRVRGNEAERWLRRRRYTDKDGIHHIRYNLYTKASLELKNKFTYLGVCLSYDNFEAQTMELRLAKAQQHKQRLQKVLQGRGGLTLKQRLRLWQVCVQTSQLYGLEAIGVTEATLRLLKIQTLKHLRAIAKSPRHITKESDEALLLRLKMASPSEVLTKRMRTMIARHEAQHRPTCFLTDRILERVQACLHDLQNIPDHNSKRDYLNAACAIPVLLDGRPSGGTLNVRVAQEINALFGQILPATQALQAIQENKEDQHMDAATSQDKDKGANKRHKAEATRRREKRSRPPSANGSDKETTQLTQLVKLMGHLVLRQSEQLNRISTETGFFMVLETPPTKGSITPVMFQVASEWRKCKQNAPDKLTASLSTTMFLCILQELRSRSELILHKEEAKTQAVSLKLLTQENEWKYRKWDPKTETLVEDTTKEPLPHALLVQTLENIQEEVSKGQGVTNFQATKQLTETMENEAVPFMLDVGLRDDAFHKQMLRLVDLGAMMLIAARLRTQRSKATPQMDKLYKALKEL
ncbi:unnamed protein product [Symbiodinium sp. CCMP2592]|nr:unnamed protein product [Symbiodinium sp. CCMP2592]